MVHDELRTRILSVIQDVADHLKVVHAQHGIPVDDPSDSEQLRRDACARVGVDELAYLSALDADPSLAEVERAAMTEAIAGTSDPGPHDAVSRESPSGRPGDLTKPRSEAVRKKMSH